MVRVIKWFASVVISISVSVLLCEFKNPYPSEFGQADAGAS